MSETTLSIDAVTPEEAYGILSENENSVLIDVRTRAEWTFVGLPDLGGIGKRVWPVEWVTFPAMTPNPAFLDEIEALVGETGGLPERMLFICRSGARSMMAAKAVAGRYAGGGRTVHCTNVAEGFEGDPDAERHRGTLNGWKARGLPWAQN